MTTEIEPDGVGEPPQRRRVLPIGVDTNFPVGVVVQHGLKTSFRHRNIMEKMGVALPSYGLMKHMPFRQQVQSLRDRARRLRNIADSQPTPLSEQLRAIAEELDAIADRANPQQGDPVSPSRI